MCQFELFTEHICPRLSNTGVVVGDPAVRCGGDDISSVPAIGPGLVTLRQSSSPIGPRPGDNW